MSERESGWWDSLFNSKLWLKFHEQHGSGKQTERECSFIEGCLRLDRGAKILDIPSGNGRHLVEMATRGYKVTGVDNAAALIDTAWAKAKQANVEVTISAEDMRDISFAGEFDGAYCMWGSFGYFDDAGNQQFLDAVGRSLKSGGRFILDTQVVETLLPNYQERDWRRAGDVLVVEERRYDYEQSRIETILTFIRDGVAEPIPISIRIYSFRSLAARLQAAGFEDLKFYGSIDKAPFRTGSERLFAVATKK